MNQNRAIVIGSVAFDIIFSVHNEFKKELVVKDNYIADISMMLTANKKKVYFGGTAGNISYGLGIQGYSPILISSAGKDFIGEFNTHLIDNGVDTRVKIYEEEYTANFYSISDIKKEQIGIFQPNTHEYIDALKISNFITQKEKDNIKVAIVSPGTGKSILSQAKELREIFGKDIKLIVDPSQILSIFFTEADLDELLSLADIFIGNETEVQQLKDILNMNIESIFNLGVKTIIETRGSKGVLIHEKNTTTEIDALPVENFVEATGAGDAFRSGFIGGMLDEKNLIESVKQGVRIAAKSVQFEGGQIYKL